MRVVQNLQMQVGEVDVSVVPQNCNYSAHLSVR